MSDREPVNEYSGFAAEQFLRATESSNDSVETPFGSRDDLRRYAIYAQRQHNPAFQKNGYDRCEHCHYTRHPCDVYDLATAVLWLLDDGRTDDPWQFVERYGPDEG